MTVTLPGSFTQPQDVFLGLRLDAANTVAESREGNNDNRKPGADRDWIALVRSEVEEEPNDSPAKATALALPSQTTGSITAGDRDFYRLTLTEPGRLTAGLRATGFAARLSLFDASGHLLIQSDGQTSTDAACLIDQHLTAGAGGASYFLRVDGLTGGTGGYALTVDCRAAIAPFEPVPTGVPGNDYLTTGDVNGDGLPDLTVANNGDGVVALLLGDPTGPSIAALFGDSDLAHPTDIDVDAELNVYVTTEGRESAVLLTSFGVPVPTTLGEEQPRALPNVMVLLGPGLPTAQNVIAPDEATAVVDTNAPGGGLVDAVALVFPEVGNEGGGDDGTEEADPGPEAAVITDAAINQFMMGQDEAMKRLDLGAVSKAAVRREWGKALHAVAERLVQEGWKLTDVAFELFRVGAGVVDEAREWLVPEWPMGEALAAPVAPGEPREAAADEAETDRGAQAGWWCDPFGAAFALGGGLPQEWWTPS